MKKICRCLFDMVTVLVKLSWGPGPIDDKLRRCITFEMISGLIKIEFLNFKTCLSHCSTSIIRKFSFYDNQYIRLRFRAIMVNRSVCSFLLPFCSLCEIVVLSWIPWIIHTHTHSHSHTLAINNGNNDRKDYDEVYTSNFWLWLFITLRLFSFDFLDLNSYTLIFSNLTFWNFVFGVSFFNDHSVMYWVAYLQA